MSRPPCTWAPRTRARNGNSWCATTASASSRSTSSASSWCSSACTTRASTRERGSAWRSSRKWSSATAAASGCSPSPAPARRFTSPCQGRGKPRMDDATKGSRPVEILLVEDNPGDERLTREALKEGKVYSNMHWVKDGVEAMLYLRREGKFSGAVRPDIILLDLNLPKKDGREVLEEIKQDPQLKCIPVVVLTTSKAEEDVLKTYGLHANCYVTKPVDLDKFITVVKSIDAFWLSVVTLPPGHG